ncbi:hypothetical protein [Psychrosphaera aestuarii]|uniref:hypothetical protein n=1 Tax=Psychrosphaera aestuarii TaxID=1266052 RepID=UPI001B341DC2|nr:hypothetical protein [Psychrosphaera aestuarii]
MKFNKLFLALSISALTACGGGSDSKESDGGGTGGVVVTPPVETAISGKSVKGVMTNAVVKVFKYVDNAAVELTAAELKDSNIVTDAQGNYTFTVLDYNGPIKVEVSVSSDANSPTTMLCDAPSGCGGVAFGQEVNLTANASDFMLTSISSVESGTPAKVNVSPLTHIATALVESSTEITAESVQQNVSKVANTFGIQGSIVELEPTSVNSASDVASEENAEELRYGLINAGIAESLFNGEGTITSKLASATTDLVENDGDLLISPDGDDEFEFNLVDIFEGASKTASLVAENIAADSSIENGADAVTGLTQLENNLENESANQVILAGEEGRTQAESEQQTEGDAVAKAKAMVNDVRVFANLFDKNHSSNQGIRSQGEALMTLIDDAEAMVQLEGDNFTLLAQVSEAITMISMEDNGDKTSFDLAEYLDPQTGVTGIVILQPEDFIFSVDAAGNQGERLKLAVELGLDEVGDKIELTLSGTMESNNAKFEIKETSGVYIALDKVVTKAQLENGQSDAEITGGGFKLELAISQKATDAVANPVMFEGKLVADLVMVSVPTLKDHYFDQEQYQSILLADNQLFSPENEQSPIPDSVTFSGVFSSAEGESFSAALTFDVDEVAAFVPSGFTNGTGSLIDGYVISLDVSQDANTLSYTLNPAYFEDSGTSTTVYKNLSENDLRHDNITRSYSRMGYVSDRITEVQHIQHETAQGTNLNEYRKTVLIKVDSDNPYIYVDYKVARELDTDNDGIADMHETVSKGLYEQELYEGEFSVEAFIDSDGNITVLPEKAYESYDSVNGQFIGLFDDYVNLNLYIQDPVVSALDWFQTSFELKTDNKVYDLWDTNLGIVMSVEADLRAVKAGAENQLVGGILVQPILKDAMTLSINDADTEFSISVDGGPQWHVSSVENQDGYLLQYNSELISKHFSQTHSLNAFSVGSDENSNAYTLFRELFHEYSDGYVYREASILLLDADDTNQDGEISLDEWHGSIMYGSYVDESGQLRDELGEVVNSGYTISPSYEDLNFKQQYGVSLFDFVNESNSASSVLVKLHEYNRSEYYNYLNPFQWSNVDGIGQIGKFELLEEMSTSDVFLPGATNSFDVYVIEPENDQGLESEDNYLDIAASLSVGVVLQDYEIALMLSGARTGFDDGKFSLDVAYKTPESESQRSFKVMVESLDSNSIVATNSEAVVLRMNGEEVDADDDTDVVIGEIRVGAQAELAAEVIQRGSAVFIKYKDEAGTIETL